MSGDNQLTIPESFVNLYVAPGAIKPSLDKTSLYARYEFCEDLANLLTEHAANIRFDTGCDESDVLERCLRGLQNTDSGVQSVEAPWVIGRLAELMNWPPLTTDLPSADA